MYGNTGPPLGFQLHTPCYWNYMLYEFRLFLPWKELFHGDWLNFNAQAFLQNAYRHDWDILKNMLSFQLKQILSEYPDAEKTSEQQITTLGETYLELVKRLDEALHGFTEGPPFTLQRLCEVTFVCYPGY